MRIREGRGSDIRACVRILRESPEYFTEEGVVQGERHLASQSTLVVVERGRVVGFATAVRKSVEVAELVVLAVAPAWRRRGVGRRLLDAHAERFRADGVALLEVKTLAEEAGPGPYEGVRRFYRTNGFHLVETVDPFPGWRPGNPCAIYVRPLGARRPLGALSTRSAPSGRLRLRGRRRTDVRS